MKIIPEYPVVVTVMPGFFMNISAAPETIPRMDSICHLEENCLERSSSIKTKVKILGSYESESSDTGLPITQAEVIVAAGRGIGRPENLELIGELAECFIRSAVAGSRAVIDAGLLPHGRQVGLTGKTVAPRLYIACGISGSPQHIAGMKASALVAAINKDPNAAIFSHSHYCIVEDLEKFIPVLIDELKSVHF
jgi:electron transfer flavoprotein alpha subunit